MMTKATKLDKQRVISVLSASFYENKSVSYILGPKAGHSTYVRALMEYSFNTCMDFGEVWISRCGQSCALLLFPDKKRLTFSSLLRDLNFVFFVIGLLRIQKIYKREKLISSCYDNQIIKDWKNKGAYLWFIGTLPSCQGIGKGSRMLTFISERTKELGRRLYLETSAIGNLKWYKSFGLEVYDQIILDFPLYFLRKPNN